MARAHWVIFGSNIGIAAAWYGIAKFGAQITLVDPDREKLKENLSLIERLCPGISQRIASTSDFRASFPSDTSIIVSCAPHRFNYALTRRAIEYGIPYCGLGGCNQTICDQKVLIGTRGDPIPVVEECGLSPGFSNILAADLAANGCDRIHVYCGGTLAHPPSKRENKFRHVLFFSPAGVAYEYCWKSPQIRDGKIAFPDALSPIIRFDRKFEAAPTGNNSMFTAHHLKTLGVQEYVCWTLRPHGHFAAIKAHAPLHDADMCAAWLAEQPEFVFDPARHKDQVTLVVAGSNSLIPEKEVALKYHFPYNEAFGITAMRDVTGFGIALVANEIAQGKAPMGFSLPQEWVNPSMILTALEQKSDIH